MSSSEHHADAGRWWARGIVVAILFFAVGTLTMVGIALSTNTDLVSSDYYPRQIDYQQQIERLQRTQALPEGVAWSLDLDGEQVVLRFPPGHFADPPSGTIRFYRPDDASQDREVAIHLDGAGRQRIDGSLLSMGRWRVQIEWQAEGHEYYTEAGLHLLPGSTGS
jgi:hypothetical protein